MAATDTGLTSDAYATGQALAALGRESGAITVNDTAYRRGATYLFEHAAHRRIVSSCPEPRDSDPAVLRKRIPRARPRPAHLTAAATNWATMATRLMA